VQDDQLGQPGVVVHLARLLAEILGLEDAALPHLADAAVQLLLGLGASHHAHFVGDDLVQRGLGLEAIAVAVPLEEPTLVVQQLGCFVHQQWLVARRQHGQQQIGRVHPAGDPLGEAVQKHGRSHATGVGRFAGVDPYPVQDLGMGRRACLWAGDVGLDHLLEGRAFQAAGQIFDGGRHRQAHVVGVDQPGIGWALLPQLAHDQRQQAQRPACLLKVRDGRDLAVEGIEQFRVEGIVVGDLLRIFRP